MLDEKTLNLDLKTTLSKHRLVGLYQLMKGFRWHYFGAMLSVAAGATIRTLYYRLLQYVVDDVFGHSNMAHQLPMAAAGFVGIAALEGLFAYLRGTWAAKTAEGITLRLRNYLFDHIQRLSFGFHDYVKTGELIQRSTSDVDALRRFYA
ncbi:MAG TPA: ABC transporter ATP-binding protein, partial [Chloroflexi bacterium]|nr:ABC transporter ATP-binding protein [Chloroflexota bacterium]